MKKSESNLKEGFLFMLGASFLIAIILLGVAAVFYTITDIINL